MRFYVDRRPIKSVRRKADLVFPRLRIAVFVDGCFWHGCPTHCVYPKVNADWWMRKIHGNSRRDSETTAILGEQGWLVVRVWEHDDPDESAERVHEAIKLRSE
jgi:DNA mismatch endonuclease (patch repair protein)